VGEYAALYAAGVLTFENALRLVRARGEAMQMAAVRQMGTMAAIIGLDPEKISAICSNVTKDVGVCTPANFNSSSQTVIAGSVAGVLKAMELAKEAGAAKTVQLNVAGAFHSPLMSPAVDILTPLITSTPFSQALVPVFTNVDAALTVQPDDFKRKLVEQIDHSVRWDESMQNLLKTGADIFIEVGAGKVLSSLMKRLDRQKTTLSSEDLNAIEQQFGLTSASKPQSSIKGV